MDRKAKQILLLIVEEMGPDVEYVRPSNGKLYYTGFEVAMLVASQVTIAILLQYLSAFGKEIKISAKKGGKRHAQLLVKKLAELEQRFWGTDLEDQEKVKTILTDAESKIVESLGILEQGDQTIQLDDSYRRLVERSLIKYGMEKKAANEHATEIIKKINKKLGK